MLSPFLLIIPFLLSFSQTQTDKCRVLVMEGGGDRGIYLAGAFAELVS